MFKVNNSFGIHLYILKNEMEVGSCITYQHYIVPIVIIQ